MGIRRLNGMTKPALQPPVRRRRVYYISGFDPRGARFYHQLYRTEAELQQAINGASYQVGRREKTGEYTAAWDIVSRSDGDAAETETRYSFLGWDDLIRANWPATTAAVVGAIPGFYWGYTADGGVRATWRCIPHGIWSLLSPLIWLSASLLLALLVFVGGLALAAQFAGSSAWLAGFSGVLLAFGVLKAALSVAEKVRLPWLMRILLFVRHWGRQRPAALDARWVEFAAGIHADLSADAVQGQPADEVLIVGHSVGALGAIAVVDAFLQQKPALPFDRIRMLTFGNITPMLGFVPEAGWFREQVARVGASAIAWKDYSAPSDPLCYALVDPFQVCGLAAPGGAGFEVRSARFDLMFPAQHFKTLRRDAFRIHFQYLMSTQLPVGNDFFSLTAGPAALVVRPAEPRP
jgi:hypothetical protein